MTSLTVNDDFYLPKPAALTSTGYTVNKLNQYTASGAMTGTDANGTPIITGGMGRFISIPMDELSIVIPSVPKGKTPKDSGIDPGGNTMVHDLNGNLRRWTGPDGKRNAYTYDAENRVRTAVTSTRNATYDYDALGRRISKTVDGVTTGYLLDGDEEIAEYNVPGSGVWPATPARRYVMGPAIDDRVAVVETSGTVRSYYHVNHQGSVLATTDSTGAVVQRLSYDEYGNLGAGSTTTGQVFRFTGRRFDEETGLYYYRARYYAPQIGRFLQTDPVGYMDDVNLYAYVGNDPLNATDPTGREIRLQAHPVVGRINHAKVTIIPNNQAKYRNDSRFTNRLPDGRVYATLGAGPSSNNPIAPGSLVSAPNRERDVIQGHNVSDELLTLPAGVDEDAMIEQLFGADAAYQDDLDYDFFPGRRVESEGNNSNSYASGLLRAVGFQNFGRPPNTPGFNLPVTTGNFKKATVEITECSTEPDKCGS